MNSLIASPPKVKSASHGVTGAAIEVETAEVIVAATAVVAADIVAAEEAVAVVAIAAADASQ